jgi:hypothetical protein
MHLSSALLDTILDEIPLGDHNHQRNNEQGKKNPFYCTPESWHTQIPSIKIFFCGQYKRLAEYVHGDQGGATV